MTLIGSYRRWRLHRGRLARLRRALDELPPIDSEVYRLASSRDLSLQDISAQLGIPTEVVERRLAAALNALSRALEEQPGWSVASRRERR